MKRINYKLVIGMGIFCTLFLTGAVWYSIIFNESRLVVPTDFAAYRFQMKDLPMFAAIITVFVYVVCLFIWMFGSIIRNRQERCVNKRTRVLNPKLGWMGFFGFLGFTGFYTYSVDKTIFPFCFFLFWGFFGFFYEGKMSGTFMDERFKENYLKAQLMSYKIGFGILFFSLLIFGRGSIMGNLDNTAIILIIVISATLGLTLFLSEYLLYRYDHDESLEEEE